MVSSQPEVINRAQCLPLFEPRVQKQNHWHSDTPLILLLAVLTHYMGWRGFRMQIDGRVISCILNLSRGKAMICLSAQREKARCPESSSISPHPPLMLLTNRMRELPSLALEPRSLSCGAAAWEALLTTPFGREDSGNKEISKEENKQFSTAF